MAPAKWTGIITFIDGNFFKFFSKSEQHNKESLGSTSLKNTFELLFNPAVADDTKVIGDVNKSNLLEFFKALKHKYSPAEQLDTAIAYFDPT